MTNAGLFNKAFVKKCIDKYYEYYLSRQDCFLAEC